MVKDIDNGIYGSYPSYLTAVGNTLYFSASDGSTEPNCGRAMETPQVQ